MDNIKKSIQEPTEEGQPRTIVIDSVQLRSIDDTDRPIDELNPLYEREPVLKTVSINTDSGSVEKTELQIGDSDNNPTGIVTRYLKNKLVEISDDQITIKDGTNEGGVLFTIKVNDDKDLSISVSSLNDALVLNSSGQIKKMLIDDASMIYNTANTSNYVDGQLLFIKDVSATTSGS